MKPLLLLIDFQRDYLGVPGLEPAAGSVVERAARLLTVCRERKVPLVHVRTAVSRDLDQRMVHWKKANRWSCEIGTPGYQPSDGLAEQANEPVIHKTGFSGFAATGLTNLMQRQGADTLILAGVYLHACVRQTALDAYQNGKCVWIAEDAVASDDPLHAALTRRYLEDRSVRFFPVEVLIDILSGSQRTENGGPQLVSVATAVDRSVHCSASWRLTDRQQRMKLVERLLREIANASGKLTGLIVNETGKPVRFSRAEVERSGEMLAAISARALAAPETEPAGSAALRRRPHGTVAVITPFNNPVYLPLGKIIPAVLYGNTVVWKPAPEALGVSRCLLSLMRAAEWPDGLVNLVEGDRRVGQSLLQDARIDAVTITGSSAAGFSAQEASNRRRIPLQAELGGNNAAIVWDDADLQDAARQVAAGAFDMAGQRCTANRRVIVQEAVSARFLDLLWQESRALPWGDPWCEETRIGPLVNSARCVSVARMVQRAAAACGPVLLPHGPDAPAPVLTPNRWYPPTIVCCENPQHEIVQEETFGPVLVVQTAKNWEHAIGLCNGVRQGLVAAIFSRSRARTERFLNEAQAGILKINRSTADAAVDVPFGGWKASGLGPPEHGEFDLDFFTRPQTVYGNPLEVVNP
jgi:acyl-CoA reductase-like NAD-dependent aldehyde dehydrogenase/nicotinamidase-related amidase